MYQIKLLFSFLFLLQVFVFAQNGSVSGNVTEEGQPFPSVNIIVMETGSGTVADDQGNYIFKNLPPGEYKLRFSSVGYETVFFTVRVEPGKTTRLDVNMKIEPVEVGVVEVTDKRRQETGDTRTSFIDVSPRSAKILPGAVEDVMRTLQALPGVLAPNDFTSQLIIRGSGPDQNLIIMDDIEVFNPYRLYGVISMFNPDAVSEVNLVTGGFPVRYGDRLSAVLDVTNREGDKRKSLSGNINASIIDANLVLEGKNPFNIPGSWLVNSRRTYYDLIIEPFVKNAGLVDENVAFPNFYDVQAKLVFGPFKGHKFLINGIHSRDGVDIVSSRTRKTPDSIGVFNETLNQVLGAAWHYIPSKKVLNKMVFSYYRNSGVVDFDSRVLDPSLDRDRYREVLADTISKYLLNVKFNTDFIFEKYAFDNKFTYMWRDHTFEAGAGADIVNSLLDLRFNLDPQLKSFFLTNPQFQAVLNNLRDEKTFTRYRLYAENNFSLNERFFIHPGIRMDYYDVLNKTYLSPRLSVSYGIDAVTTLRGVFGFYYQSPGYEKVLDQSALLDLSDQNTMNLEAENALHYVLGIERWFTDEWNVRIEGYYKDFKNLIIQNQVRGTNFYTERVPGQDPRYKSGWTRPIPVDGDSLTQVPVNDAYGEAYGLELLIARKNVSESSRLSGWISFAHAYAYRYDYEGKLPFRFDQRNTVNIVMNYRINSWLYAGLRWQYGSGFPYSEPSGISPRIIYADTDLDGNPDSPELAVRRNEAGEDEIIYDVNYGSRKLNSRKPPYHRLDVRFTAVTNFWSLDWTFYLDIINAYNRSNVIGYDYYISPELTLEREKSTMFPIIPTFGFSVKF